MDQSPPRHIPSLTMWRGAAALGIVSYHGIVAFAGPLAERADVLKTGVTFFFVLSGFVLTYSWRDQPAIVQWQHRAARILPAYLLAWLLTLAGRSFVHWVPSQEELLATLLLVQAWVPSPKLAMAVNPVGWSLSCELLCYLALPLIVPSLRRMTITRLQVLSAAVAGWAILGCLASQRLPIEWWVGYRASEFTAGVLTAEWFRRGRRLRSSDRRLALCALLALGVAVLMSASTTVLDLMALPVVTWLVLHSAERVTHDQTTPISVGATRSAALAIGRWSYALYLTHWVVLILLSRYLVGAAWIIPAALVCLVLAAGVHRWVERPAERLLRDVPLTRVGSPTPAPDLNLVIGGCPAEVRAVVPVHLLGSRGQIGEDRSAL